MSPKNIPNQSFTQSLKTINSTEMFWFRSFNWYIKKKVVENGKIVKITKWKETNAIRLFFRFIVFGLIMHLICYTYVVNPNDDRSIAAQRNWIVLQLHFHRSVPAMCTLTLQYTGGPIKCVYVCVCIWVRIPTCIA